MRDSWIDKEEFEELVGAFTSPKKGARRRLPAAPRKKEDARPAAGEDTPGGSGLAGGAEPSGLPRGDVSLPEEAGGFPGSPAASAGAVVLTILNPVEEPLEECFEETSDSWGDEAVAISDGLPPLFEPGPAIGSPPLVAGMGRVENFVVEDPPDEAAISQRVPLFFEDDPGISESSLPLVSERETDRSLLALAEARARVDKGQLIRAASSGGAPVKTDQPRSLNFPFLFEPSGALHERMSQYGECARRELGAREVAVCDRDGLFLYRSSLSSGEGGLEAALLVAVSDRVTRLFGLEGATAMQVADESGGWRCLIACVESGLFVGFSLVEPLDYGEVEIWSKALAEALPPPHFFPSEPPE